VCKLNYEYLFLLICVKVINYCAKYLFENAKCVVVSSSVVMVYNTGVENVINMDCVCYYC